MDNQHRQFKGYRELSQDEIDCIKRIKMQGEMLGAMCEEIGKTSGVDARWVAIAKTHLQQGIMALIRSVARPESF
jgi:hypothetical protein